jgi:hypothetical protein
MNSALSGAGERKGCKSAAVSSLKRRYPEAELLFENRHPRKQGQGSALGPVRRTQPYLALALEEMRP